MMKNYRNLEHQLVKVKHFKVRVTTFIHGELKNKFLSDCISKKITEADMARHIIDSYYKNRL